MDIKNNNLPHGGALCVEHTIGAISSTSTKCNPSHKENTRQPPTCSHVFILLVSGLLALLSACGSSSNEEPTVISGPAPTIFLSGLAYDGSPIANQAVVVKGKNGTRVSANTDSNGRYSIDVTKLEAPYVLQTSNSNGIPIFSISYAGGIVNLHSISNILALNLFAINGLDLPSEFTRASGFTLAPTEPQYSKTYTTINNIFSVTYVNYVVAENFNFISSDIVVNDMTFIALLNSLTIQMTNNKLTIVVKDPLTGLLATLMAGLDISIDLSQVDSELPSTPQVVKALAANDNSIVLEWQPATDDIAVAGYNIYRDGTFLAKTSFPMYTDTGLIALTQYCYQVEAIDSAKNTSVKSDSICATTLAGPDITAPAKLTDVTAMAASASSITVNWTKAPETDVAGYTVFKKVGSDFVNVATTTDNTYIDTGLDASTEYCYTVQVFDASSNVSDTSNVSCVSTNSPVVPDTTPPAVSATPATSDSIAPITVKLICDDHGGSGCATTYYTTDGSAPTTASNVYNPANDIVISVTTSLRFIAVDNAGNPSEIGQEIYTITIPAVVTLTVTNQSTLGVINSNVSGINCGTTCQTTFASNTQVVLTATHPQALTAIWSGGCMTIELNQCTVDLSQDRSVQVSFGGEITESANNDTFLTAQEITGVSVVSGYFNAATDADYYMFTATKRSTFYANISHPTGSSFLALYNNAQQLVTSSGGCCGAKVHGVSYSVDPGVYYLRVLSNNVTNLITPYTLNLSGTALGSQSPDSYEENDSFVKAVPVTTNGLINGYLDTINDTDYFSFEVTARSTFLATYVHANASSFMNLYNSQIQNIASSGGCCGSANHKIAISLNPGTYYLEVKSNNVSNLTVPYSLSINGTALGGLSASPDTHEENDSAFTATSIAANGPIQGYLDTTNDADYFTFNVTNRSTFIATYVHATASSFMTLYNASQQVVTSSGGCCGAANHTLTQSLDPGTYYLRVLSNNTSNLVAPYVLSIGGTALGGASPDIHEENDSFATATALSFVGNVQGYLDTINDVDFFTFDVAKRSTFIATYVHATASSFMDLYNTSQQLINSSGGCCGSTNHTLAYTLNPGTYYLRIRSNNVSNLSVAYNLSIAGSALDGIDLDIHEENDSPATATPITGNGLLQSFVDTTNDADYYQFVVTAAGTFTATYVHPNMASFMGMYNAADDTLLANSGGCCGSANHTFTVALDPGTYYLRVTTNNVFNRTTAYSLTISGTVLP